ncbi:hypothetical protein [Arenicella xantha]|uniref:Uncharacterized protein n=1 Tax=Arenicella xantha TaxID=644221 RepID=A0A395JNG0_9GAMM|nr:hypothetical protein [Arenicella xantha]RBP53109.1 hypothetical protein DFR28_101494 [Arenicella xantha]
MTKKKKSRRQAATPNPQVSNELNKIMTEIDNNLRQSEQSISDNLKKTYDLIDQAKGHLEHINEPTVEPLNKAQAVSGSYPTVADAQKSMDESMDEANMQVRKAAHTNQSAQSILETQSMEMPTHLQAAMESVQQSINATAAALQHGMEQKNAALEQLMNQQTQANEQHASLTQNPDSTEQPDIKK